MSALAILALAQATVPPLTAEGAQTLPVAELAHIVLGEAGSNVIDVDRPTWPTCLRGLCPPVTDADRARAATAAPLSEGLTFYERPTAQSDLGWEGLCATQTFKVKFGDNGVFKGIEVGARFEAPTGIRRRLPTSDFMEQYRGYNDKCGTLRNVKRFFYSGNGDAAFNGLIGLALAREKLASDKPVTFKFRCEQGVFGIKDCRNNRSSLIEILDSTPIREIQQDSCSPNADFNRLDRHACYRVELNEGETVNVELVRMLESARLISFSYQHDMVVY